MTPQRTLAATTAMLALGAALTTAQPAAAEDLGSGRVAWHACPQYSDEVLAYMGLDPEDMTRFREQWARTECGTVSVPLDYGDPHGEKISVEITRLPATDRRHRQGSIAVNPGGPGGSGYLMPVDLVLRTPTGASLNERYDLIGFDPRGIGYSTKWNCDALDGGGEPPLGAITEDQARAMYAEQVAANQACSQSNPAFLRQVGSVNIARDLDRVRDALGERRLGYLGVSWGTELGALYRSMFPERVSRMWLDSTAPPNWRFDTFTAARAKASEEDADRLAAWLAEHDDVYGFGSTAGEVTANIAALRADYDANPRRFTDLDMPLDGVIVALSADQDAPIWDLVGQVLVALRDATGPTAPPIIKDIVQGPPRTEPPAGLPEQMNRTANAAIFCNEDTGPQDFDTAWRAYQENQTRYPLTGRLNNPIPSCAGWTLPAKALNMRHNDASLRMSGHVYEDVSPWVFTTDMQKAIGGGVVTVHDDVHGSALGSQDCAALIVSYFKTGRNGSECQGAPGPREPSAGLAAADTRPLVDAIQKALHGGV